MNDWPPDLTKIDFPSDALTIKTLRRMHPEDVDGDPNDITLFAASPASDFLTQLVSDERMIAICAYQLAIGNSSPGVAKNHAETAAALAESLVRYGLASGRHHAEQLIRGIEAQAAKEASRDLGRSP